MVQCLNSALLLFETTAHSTFPLARTIHTLIIVTYLRLSNHSLNLSQSNLFHQQMQKDWAYKSLTLKRVPQNAAAHFAPPVD